MHEKIGESFVVSIPFESAPGYQARPRVMTRQLGVG
jgi:hypothetical protein